MRLSKVKLVRKWPSESTASTNSTPLLLSADRSVVGAFWYVKEELDDHQARKIARAKQLDGYRGNIFYGSAEKVWKEREGRRNGQQRKRRVRELPADQLEGFVGRSYGLLSDEECDDKPDGEDDDCDQQVSSQQSFASLITQRDPLSPPLSPTPHQSLRDQASDIDEEYARPMPGSFIFEGDTPTSPAFSASLVGSMIPVSEILFSTPTRPSYINPGLVLEHRYDISSPLSQNSRFDMTPRQLAAFSRRKQGFAKLLERPTTPSVMSDAETDDWGMSEKDKAERERRRKDLQKFRLERRKRLRIENALKGDEEMELSRKRPRDEFEHMEMDFQPVENPPKKSRSSEIFTRALHTNPLELEPRMNVDLFEPHHAAMDNDKAKPPGEINHLQVVSVRGCEPGAVLDASGQSSTNRYGAPTPSPSPPLNPDSGFPKQAQPHVPKIPSGLRETMNVSSSPATSPMKLTKVSPRPTEVPIEGFRYSARNAVDYIPRSSYMGFEFPPLQSAAASQSSARLLAELATYFKATTKL